MRLSGQQGNTFFGKKMELKRRMRTLAALTLVLLSYGGLAGCALRPAAAPVLVYDFGPGSLVAEPLQRTAPASPLALPPVQAIRALDSTAVYYRLLYNDALQPKPYAQARWSMPVAELIDQKLRYLLGQERSLINPADNLLVGQEVRILQMQLDEFSHTFETPQRSIGLLKMRVTLVQPSMKGARLLAQRSFTVQQPSATPDAAGGVQALSAAVDVFANELNAWLQQVP